MAGENNRRPFSRLDKDDQETDLPGIDTLRRYFKEFLKEKGIDTKDKWTHKVLMIPLWRVCAPAAKFLLMAASDVAISDVNRPGHMVLGRAEKKLFDINAWNDKSVETIEHVIPQARGEDWKDSKFDLIYAQDEQRNYLLHGIGNLALCSKETNSSFGNASWTKKRRAYQLCSATTEEEAQKLTEDFQDLFSQVSLNNYGHKYLPMLEYLSKLDDGGLTPAFIEERGKEIASLAWNRIARWLELAKN